MTPALKPPPTGGIVAALLRLVCATAFFGVFLLTGCNMPTPGDCELCFYRLEVPTRDGCVTVSEPCWVSAPSGKEESCANSCGCSYYNIFSEEADRCTLTVQYSNAKRTFAREIEFKETKSCCFRQPVDDAVIRAP